MNPRRTAYPPYSTPYHLYPGEPPTLPPNLRLAEAYVPYQQFNRIFEPHEGIVHGTIFPELVRTPPEADY